MAPTDKPDPTLGPALRRLRECAGISQEELAFRSNVTINSIGRIERSEANPTWTTIRRIVEALDCTLADLAVVVERPG